MTLVSILGDFHSSILPISFEFKEQASKHIIVYDDAYTDTKECWRILRGQKAFMKSLSTQSKDKYEIVTMRVDEDSYESLNECFERIVDVSDKKEQIYLNTTDGLSSVAMVLSSKILSLGAKVIAYDRYANSYNLHTSNTMVKYKIKNNMDIASHLMLKGYTLQAVTKKQDLEKRKAVIYALSEDLTDYKQFVDLLHKMHVDDICGYERYKSLLESIGKLGQQVFMQGTVFEEYIYHLIVDNLDFDDVWVGTKVLFEEAVENEFDILMIKDNHLHTIECKFVSSLNGEHFVYKTELIKDYLDDDGKAMILSIGADNQKHAKAKKQFTFGDEARAKHGGIKIHLSKEFDEKKFLKDVKDWFL